MTWVLSGSFWPHEKGLSVGEGAGRDSREAATAAVRVGEDSGLAWRGGERLQVRRSSLRAIQGIKQTAVVVWMWVVRGGASETVTK